MDQSQTNQGQRTSNAPYVVMFVGRTLAVSVEVFLHRNMGVNAIGVPGLAALLLMPLWAAFWPEEDATPLLGFWWLFIAMCILSKVSSAVSHVRRRRPVQHSRYSGWPRLKFLVPWCSELTFKKYVEPLLVVCAGLLFMSISAVLGSYLITAGIALGAWVISIEAAERARAQQMHDAYLSQREMAERFRRLSGDH